MLDRLLEAKQDEIKKLEEMEENGTFPPPYPRPRPNFFKVLWEKKGIIAEIKKGSPSLGVINPRVKVKDLALAYEKNGAVAVSVLTEQRFFFSSPDFLWEVEDLEIPVLRKDFIIDPLQIKYTATTPASALLLIVKAFRDRCEKLMQMVGYANLLGLECVVEVFDYEEVEFARCAGARVIQVNNRDLDTLKVDPDISRRLIKLKKGGEIWICASGISRREEVEEMLRLGFDACLIGTSLMKAEDPARTLASLLPKNFRIWMGKSYVT